MEEERKYSTKEQFSEWAKEAGVNVESSFYENVDPKLYDAIVKTETEMFKRFPEVKAYQDSYYPWELRYTGDSYLMEAQAGLNFGMAFNDADRVYWNVIDGQTTGYLTSGDGTLQTVIRHEYGHEADSYCRSKFSTLNSTYEDHVSGKEARRHEAARQYEHQLYEISHKYGSEYSRFNAAESFAEGFAEYTSNPSSEFCKAFGEFFERWYYANPIE